MTSGLSRALACSLYVVRHGETDWNAERRYQGQADIPMNDKGRAQAKRNGQALAALHLNIEDLDLVASPLGRARETMEIVLAELGRGNAVYRTDPRLKELSYGHWQGVLQSELPDRDPDGVAQRKQDAFQWRPRDGESYADLCERTETWLAEVTADTLVAAHGGTIRCLHGLLLGRARHEIPTIAVPQDKVLVIRNGTGTWI